MLARELDGDVSVLIAANPCFGLDFAAVSEIRSRIMAARNSGTAVLLVSTDLEEIFALSDRILVMSEGSIVYETTPKPPMSPPSAGTWQGTTHDHRKASSRAAVRISRSEI